MLKRFSFPVILLFFLHGSIPAQFTELFPVSEVTDVQPMTGIVLWTTSSKVNTDAISLEYSYMLFNDIVSEKGVYNWDAAEEKLDAIAGRGHQAIFRFRYVYPGYKTSVPDYILELSDYQETVGKSEGKDTHFPDWTHPELKRFTMEFYTKFAKRYDNDPRLAFIQVGFGLWAEYHIYSGPFILGETFPSKEFQEDFYYHLDSTFVHIPWSMSIDAADDSYSPFEAKPDLKDIHFGLFDDSFMHRSHSGYNTTCWNFFDRERYRTSPAGGEFSYYSSYDQEHVLDWPSGPYGKPFEVFADDFHITYMIGNDQPGYQTMDRIKDASMAAGYCFRIVSLKSSADSSIFRMTNLGAAPIYYDAWLALDGVRSDISLKGLSPGDTLEYSVSAGAENASITIECDRLIDGQEIQFYGTQEITGISNERTVAEPLHPYPNPVKRGELIKLDGLPGEGRIDCHLYDSLGRLAYTGSSARGSFEFSTASLEQGMYFLKIERKEGPMTSPIIIR